MSMLQGQAVGNTRRSLRCFFIFMVPIRFAVADSYHSSFLKFPPGKAINIGNEIQNMDKKEAKKNGKEEEKFWKSHAL